MFKKLQAFMIAAALLLSAAPAYAANADDANVTASAEEASPIRYSTENDDAVAFRVTDFEKYCLNKTGDNLSYVTFELPASSQGSLWYDFNGSNETKVTATTKYYRNSSTSSYKLINDVYFVPKASFSGKTEVTFKGYSNDRSMFSGIVEITVTASVNRGDLDKITYDIEPGQKLSIDSSDINRVCRNAGFNLSYVKFSLPSSGIGTYYYDYRASDRYNTEVSESTRYYKSSSDSGNYLIDKVTFVTSKNASGTVELTYYAYDTADEEYEGTIRIRFDSSAASTTYETNGEVVFFNASDINKTCTEMTGSKVSYVKFSYPSKGTLYYDYDNEEDSRATVRTSTKYYYSKSPYLYLIGYVPPTSYSGTVIVDYQAFNLDGDSCNGSITIKVDTKNIEKADDINYTVKNNSYLTFDTPSDFNSECRNATGERLDYIRFGTVSSGNLYYKYSDRNGSSYDSKVSSGRYYYESGDEYIKYVSYVPKSTYSGTATIKYTGYSVEGTSYTGQIKIAVKSTSSSSGSSGSSRDDDEVAKDIKYSGTVGEKIYFESSDFNTACKNLFSSKLDYVKFKIPSSSYGTLYCGKNEEVESSYKCYYKNEEITVSDVYFVPKKTGKITISYTGRSEDSEVYTGDVVITVTAADDSKDDNSKDDKDKDDTPSTPTTNAGMKNFTFVTSYKSTLFTDIDENAWYGEKQTGAIKNAYRYGLVQGKGDKKFDPTGNITVAEAITIAARVADIYYAEDTKFSTSGANWYDDYVNYAIRKKIINKGDFLNYNKAATRAEMAYIFAHVLPSSEYKKINNITSVPDVKASLRFYDEIMLLYNAGIVSGNDEKGTFAPSSNITRAEVSAIIVRVVNPEERRKNSF